MKNKIVFATAAAALPLLDSMSRDELRELAKTIGVPTGKDKKNSIINLGQAIRDGKLHFKASCTLSVNPAKQGEPSQRVTYFGKNLRTYVSGPGKGNETWLTPQNAVKGSPSHPW
jgi:hypothetical protein